MTARRLAPLVALLLATACAPGPGEAAVASSWMADPSAPTLAAIASGSADQAAFVEALTAARFTDALGKDGPWTVFAPTNAAFTAVPSPVMDSIRGTGTGTPFRTLMLHHVASTAQGPADLTEGLMLDMVDGGPLTVRRSGDTITIGGARVVRSIQGRNGWVHVVDAVLLPGSK